METAAPHELAGFLPGRATPDLGGGTLVLGQGGIGTTYEAEALAGGAHVALKELWLWHQHDWKVLELFEREARVLAMLSHPCVPRYVDSFQVETPKGPSFYLVQELAQGRSLAQWVAAGWQPTELEAHAIADTLLGILDHLQRLVPPVIHRDVKPENVIRSDDGELRLVDFGAVRDTFRTFAHGSTVVGTFGYMAPEQLHGQALPATDLYGLGATLVFLLARRDPSSLPQARGRPVWRGATKVSRPFAAFVDKLIAPVPEDRFQSARQARIALARVARERRPSLARLGAVVALGVVAIAPVVWAVRRPVASAHHSARPAAPAAEPDRRVPSGRLEFVRTLQGHLAPVMCVAWLPDGRLVSGGIDGSVRLWDATTGTQIRAYPGHTDRVSSIAVTPDGKRIVTASFDQTVRVFDVESGQALAVLTDHHDRLAAVAVSRDGTLIASAGGAGKIIIHDLASGRALRTLTEPPKVLALAFGVGSMLASGGDDGPVRLWDASTGQVQAALFAHSGPVDAVAFTPDGQTLVSSGDDHTVRVYTTGVKRLARTMTTHTDEVWALAISPDGKVVASGGKDKMLSAEDLVNNVLRARRERADERAITSLAFSPDSKLLAVAGASAWVRLWKLVAPTWRPAWIEAPVPHVDKPLPPGLSKAETLCFQAEKLMHSEVWDRHARPLVEAALKLDPDCARAYVDLGRLEYKAGYISYEDYDAASLKRAHALIDKGLALSPDLYEGHLYKAYAYLFGKDYDNAAKQAALAEASNPGEPETQLLFANLANHRGNLEEVLLHVRPLIEHSSDPGTLGPAFGELQDVYRARGEEDAVEQCFKSRINLDPESPWIKGNYAAFLVRHGEFDRAIAMVKQALVQMDYGMAHTTLADAYAGKALVLLDKGDTSGGKKLIDQALAESHNSAAAYYAMGVYEQKSGNGADADRDFLKALAVDIHYAPARSALGNKAPPLPEK